MNEHCVPATAEAFVMTMPLRAAASQMVPVIDLAPLATPGDAGLDRVTRELVEAAETVGFFYVRNHGVPAALLERAVAASRAFFALPLERKLEVKVSERHRGFLRAGEATMKGAKRPDLKESFVWGIDLADDDPVLQAGHRLLAPNNWPGFMPELRAALVPYLDACNRTGFALLRCFAHALGVSPDTFIAHIEKPVSRGGSIFYPPQPAGQDDQFGVAPHTDFGCLTLLWQDEVGGLEVQGKDGGWVPAPPMADAFVVNVGDLLARWTNDRFRSTPHRVVNRAGRSRQSIAVFVDPDFEQIVRPVTRPGEAPRYEPVSVGDYILGRYDASFAYRQVRRAS
jgi:isopenicillin N synthase-like dioxygenase